MLTLSFPVVPGEPPVQSRASCFRFCADGTLRGGDNSIAATRVSDSWRLGQRLYRELQCAGPVAIRARRTAAGAAVRYGPFDFLSAVAGRLSTNDGTLGMYLPAWDIGGADSWYEIVLLPVQSAH